MKRLLRGILLVVFGVALQGGLARAMSAGECAGLSIHVKNLAGQSSARCGTEDFGHGGAGDQGFGKTEFIQIIDADSVFVVSHAAAAGRTYMVRMGVKDAMSTYDTFETMDSWGDETESHDFKIRRFNAKLAGSGTPVTCFGLVRFAGHFASTAGYRHLISGFSCNFSATPPTDARIDELVGSITDDFE